ncbi:SRPBCC family protein [Streptosporangium sp. NPDC051022]|uniref:type II toxin-antitoxin system RatA family toxin n=1 Tax=Streptosporangium sp. NPDC051022 TaxID=3155752 RepID=UPI00341A9F17
MPTVTTSHTSTEPAQRIWEVLLDCEEFPSYMDEVVDVTILDRSGSNRTSRWAVLLKGSELEWVERDTVDHERRRIEFEQIEGDLAYFDGYWQVTDDGAGQTTIELHVEFDIGIPLMADMLNPVAARALEENSKAILNRLSNRNSDVSPVA